MARRAGRKRKKEEMGNDVGVNGRNKRRKGERTMLGVEGDKDPVIQELTVYDTEQ